jgi:hypothetical protein
MISDHDLVKKSITKYINKAYQHQNKCLSLKARFQKGDNLNANRTHPFIFSYRGHVQQSSDQSFSSRGHDRKSWELYLNIDNLLEI